MEEQQLMPGESWRLARGLVAGRALLLLGSQLLFGKQHKLVEKDLKTNEDTRTTTTKQKKKTTIRMEISAVGKELFILM